MSDQSISHMQNNAINYALVSFSILASLSYILIFIFSYSRGYTHILDFSMQTVALTVLLAVTYLRHKLSLKTKTLIVSIMLIVLSMANFYGFGLFAITKVFIVAFPVFLAFVMPFRKALTLFIFFVAIYSAYAVLYSTGVLSYSFDVTAYVNQSSGWIVSIIVVTYVSLGLMFVGKTYNTAITQKQNHIEKQNRELLEKEKKYRLLFECSNDAIALIKDNRYIGA